MDLISAEAQLCRILADKLQLKLNQELFYGELPPGIRTGVTVQFTAGKLKNLTAQNQFEAELIGYPAEPEELQSQLGILNQLFPLYGVGGFTSLETSGDLKLECHHGQREYHLNLLVVFP